MYRVADEDDGASAKARKLVKQLHEVTASAEDLAKTVADGIRRDRAVGRPFKPLAHDKSPKTTSKPKRGARKKR